MFITKMIKKSTIVLALITTCLFAGIPAQAGMVGTADVASNAHTGSALANISSQREWIQQQLEANGVEAAEAAIRVSSLSDNQVMQIHQKIEEMPAGAGALGTIAFIALVLVITDLTGLTDVFPFIRPAN